MAWHMMGRRTIYYNDKPGNCWPFKGCFGPYFPHQVSVMGIIFTNITDTLGPMFGGDFKPSIRALYMSRDRKHSITVNKDCTYTAR